MFIISSLSAYKLLFALELLVSEFLYALRLKKRNKFVLRAVASAVVLFLAAFLFPTPFNNALYTSAMFLCLFGLSLALMKLCYAEPLVNIVFCGIAAYTTRHLAFQVYSALSAFGNMAVSLFLDRAPGNPMSDLYSIVPINLSSLGEGMVFWALIYIDIYVVCYSIIFSIFGKELWKNDDLKIKNNSLLMLAGIVLFIDILLNAVLVYITDEYSPVYTIIMYVYNLLCCVLTLYMQFSLVSMKKLKKELEIVNHMWQQDREQYELAKQNIDLINLKCHDLKHQIRCIGRHESIREETVSEMLVFFK